MTTFLIVVNVLKGAAALVSLVLGLRKLHRWYRRKRRNKKKPTA